MSGLVDFAIKASSLGLIDKSQAVSSRGSTPSFTNGRKWACLGDSITNRSNASAGKGFVDQMPKIAGSANLSVDSYVESGVPGNTTAQMLARYTSDISGKGVKIRFLS